MIRFYQCVVAFLLIALSSSAAGAANTALLSATVARDSIVFSGVTPGEELVLFAASIREEWGTQTRRQFTEVLEDTDGDGVVTIQPKGGVPFRSIWVGVDLRNGAIAVAAPPDYELHHTSLPQNRLKRDGEALPVAFETNRFRIFVLIVRPGSGAWLYTGAQRGAKDTDRAANGRLTAAFGDAQPVGGKKDAAPRQLEKDDVLVVFDPDGMDLWTSVVGK